MTDETTLATRFESHRDHLRAVAYRMLGSTAEADDAVQEAWLRYRGADTSEVDTLGGWLTTVISRICLDMLRSRQSRREEPMDEARPEPAPAASPLHDPEHEAIMADAVGEAMQVVLATLSPPERLAFVLHDLFGVPFDEIAAIVDRSPAATRQLASRARRRVQGATPIAEPDREHQRDVVMAFLDAARNAEFRALLTLLDPDAVLRADRVAAEMGGWELEGGTAIAKAFSGAAQAARLALLDGMPGAVWAEGRTVRVAFLFTVDHGRIVAIDLLADRASLDEMEIEFLRRGQPEAGRS